MRNLLIAAVAIFGAYSGYQQLSAERPMHSEPHDDVIMYSLTTCGYCKQLAAQMDEEGITYEELFLDEDREVRQELSIKLTEAGFTGGGIGTPTLDVKGHMLANNPPLNEIQHYIDMY